MKTSHRGFIVPLLLIIATILLAGGGAYVYVQTKQASQSAVATSTTNYFDIKEVGLKFKITDDIKDLTYSIINQGNGATYVWFSTKTLENLGGKNCNSGQAPLGGIGVWKKDISGGAMAITYLIKSDNFSVTYGTPQSICSSVKEVQDLQMKQLRSLSEALKTILVTAGDVTLPQATSTMQTPDPSGTTKSATVTFNVYFGKETDSPDTTNCSHVIARTISYTSAVGQASLAELFKGPTPSEKQQGYFSCIIGKSVVVRSLKIENGTATVNLSKEYNNGCGGAAMCSAQARSAVTNTLKQFSEIKTVQIQIEGVPQTIGGDV